jgi:hypothetical protein
VYATLDAPPTFDALADFARARLDLDAPGADLLGSNPYAALMSDVLTGRYLGEATVGGERCDHLAYRGRDTDWELWIRKGDSPLPMRYIITSRRVAQHPQYRVEFTNWNLVPRFADSTFRFTPAPGARSVQVLPPRAIGGGPRHVRFSREGGR